MEADGGIEGYRGEALDKYTCYYKTREHKNKRTGCILLWSGAALGAEQVRFKIRFGDRTSYSVSFLLCVSTAYGEWTRV